MGADLLAGAAWTCGRVAPGTVEHPDRLEAAAIEWLPAEVPGTAAGALRAAGRWSWGQEDEQLLDGSDWWFRVRFPAPARSGPWELSLGGVATIADVWLNGEHLLHSENMFIPLRASVTQLESDNELALRCAALGPLLAARHPRPRWKSRLVRAQSLRWYRTTLLGRMPAWSAWGAPVGPWRAVTLSRADPAGTLGTTTVIAQRREDGGVIAARIVLERPQSPPQQAWLRAGGRRTPLALDPGDDELVAHGMLALDRVEPWWPHTHGQQPLYEVELELDGRTLPVRRVGFRTVALDEEDGGAAVVINGVRIFCRGALWTAPDPVSLAASPERVRESVALAAGAGMNMLRVAGYGVYEERSFWDACDELGVMVWQDCMLASVDPPEDPEFMTSLEAELRPTFRALGGRPSLTLICGSSETYQQPAMLGLAPERWASPLLEETLPDIFASVAPGIPYVPSSPSGGEPPFSVDTGFAHYFGVGAYLRPPADARLATVRFAAECLAFATPPEPETVEQVFGGAQVAGHAPRWKLAVARDAGASWDFEDVVDHYIRELFRVDPLELRYSDPERALDLARATVAELVGGAISQWRRPSSPCDGALVLGWRDLWPGAGWGLTDAFGRPKAPYFALRRACAPVAVALADDGLDGLWLVVHNDRPADIAAGIRLRVLSAAGAELDAGEDELELPAHGSLELRADSLLGGFRDLNDAYRFAPRAHDVVGVELFDERRGPIARACYLPGGPARSRLPDLGLRAEASLDQGGWSLAISTDLFAQYVAIDAPGWRPEDSWFHLLPGASVRVALHGGTGDAAPRGSVRALNCAAATRIAAR